jgi:hypothetical protein
MSYQKLDEKSHTALCVDTSDALELPNNSVVASKKITLPPYMKAALPIMTYCVASIVMTVTNKYVVSGGDFNMVFLLLTIQVKIILSDCVGERPKSRLVTFSLCHNILEYCYNLLFAAF